MPILLIVYHSLTGGTLQMAQAFSKLGQSIAAGEQVALGRKALVPLPPEADAILAALERSLPVHVQAVTRYWVTIKARV